MSSKQGLIEKLTTLNHIAQTLNQAVDVHSMLDDTLADLVGLMDLESAWISLRDPLNQGDPENNEWVLGAHHNLPPALDPDSAEAWGGTCACRRLYESGDLNEAYNEVHCSRLQNARGDDRGLAVHATTPLRSRDGVLGLLNVAAPNWASFSPQALTLLTNVGSQMGVALERARLYDLLRQQRGDEQKALLHLSGQLLSRLNLDDLINYLVHEVRELLHADACALLLPGKEPGFLEFQASSGWRQDPAAEGRRVPDDDSTGPGRAMRGQLPHLAEDIQTHDPTPWMPEWIQAEGFRGHAVVPLLVNSHSIGALVINQRKPRPLDQDDVRGLQLMANQAAIAIEKARLHQEEIKIQAMERELEVGRQIQLSLLPDGPPVVPGWEFATFYEAAREVGGDFYDFFNLPSGQDQIALVVADVAGKGVPAALFMARASSILRTTGLNFVSPSTALCQVNTIITQDRRPELFFTAGYGALDTRTGRMDYAGAGHCRPLWLHAASGQLEELVTRGIVLGIFDEVELEERSIDIAPGDLLVFYTDGVSEAMDANRQLFGEERLEATIAANAGASAQQVLEAIVDAVAAFTGDVPQSDDLTLVVVRRVPQTD